MSKKLKRKLALLIIFLLMVISVYASPAIADSTQTMANAQTVTVSRLGGNDRFQTAVSIAQAGWQSSTNAVLASGNDANLVDALTVAPLAKAINAPVLFTGTGDLNPDTKTEFQNLGTKTVYVSSGPGIIPDSTVSQLQGMGINVVRLGGNDRFQTSVNIANQLAKTVHFTNAVIANGYSNADAMSVAPIAANLSMPILLTDNNTLPQVTASFLTDNKIAKSYVIGGSGVISDSVQSQLPTATRLGGTDRFDTNQKVIQAFQNDIKQGTVYVANGNDGHLVDSLAGSVLAASHGSDIVLANQNDIPQSTVSFINDNQVPQHVVLLGGQPTIDTSVVTAIFAPTQITSNNQPASISGNAVITNSNQTLQNITINGNLVISGSGVTLKNVTVTGSIFVDPGVSNTSTLDTIKANNIIVQSGSADGMTITNSTANNLVVASSNPVKVVAQGSTSITNTTVSSDATIVNQGANLPTVTADSIMPITMTLGGTFTGNVVVNSTATVTAASGATIPSVQVSNTASPLNIVTLQGNFTNVINNSQAGINVADNSTVGTITTTQPSNVNVSSTSSVSDMSSYASGTTVSGGGSVNGTSTTETPTPPSSGGTSSTPTNPTGGSSGGSSDGGSHETLSSAKDILSFSIDSVTGVTNATSHSITLTLPSGTSLTSLTPTISVSPNASISPNTGVSQDFTNPITYTVTAQNGSTQTYTVTVTVTVTTPSIDKTALEAAIADAQTVVSDQPSGIDSGVVASYNSVISSAQSIDSDDSATQSVVDSAVTALGYAKDAYQAQLYYVANLASVNTTPLNGIIMTCASQYMITPVGTVPGDVAQSALDTLNTALQQAIPHLSGSLSDVGSAQADLSSALSAFFAAKVPYPPTISSISPNSGTTAGGTAITITVSNFTGATTVTIGGSPATSFTVVSDTEITAVTPVDGAGAVDVAVTTPGGTATSTAGFTYTAPSSGSVTLGEGSFSGAVAGDGTITGLTPGLIYRVSYEVISDPFDPFSEPDTEYLYSKADGTLTTDYSQRAPLNLGVTAVTGLTDGTTYTIIGLIVPPTLTADTVNMNISSPVVVTFTDANGWASKINGVSASIDLGGGMHEGSSVSSSNYTIDGANGTITFSSGAWWYGASQYTLQIYATGFDTATVVQDVTSTPLSPTITSITPNTGSTSGGTSVTITGTNFTGATSVMFGAASATFTITSDTQITATTPAGSTGTADVVVTTPAGTVSKAGGFTYVALSSAKDITGFSFASPSATGVINATSHTVTVTVPNATVVTALTPTIVVSPNATVSPDTGVAHDFTTPVTYTVTAQDGSTQTWTVTVTTPLQVALANLATIIAPGVASNDVVAGTVNDRYISSVPGLNTTQEDLDNLTSVTNDLITAYTNYQSDQSSWDVLTKDLASAASILAHVRVGNASGDVPQVAIDTLKTALDNASATPLDGDVTTANTNVSMAASNLMDAMFADTSAQIASLSFTGVTPVSSIFDFTNHTVTLTVPSATDETNLTPIIGLSPNTAISPKPSTTTDFSNPVTYTLSAPDGSSTFTWTVTVTGGTTPAPTITAVSPSSGYIAGGTTITITGTNLTGTSLVLVGGVSATSVTIVSDTEVTAVTPAESAGAKDVAVTTSVGTALDTGGFTYTVSQSVVTASNVVAQVQYIESATVPCVNKQVVFNVADGSSQLLPNATVYASIVGFMNSDVGTAKVGATTLDSTWKAVQADATGHLIVDYTSSSATMGKDMIQVSVSSDGSTPVKSEYYYLTQTAAGVLTHATLTGTQDVTFYSTDGTTNASPLGLLYAKLVSSTTTGGTATWTNGATVTTLQDGTGYQPVISDNNGALTLHYTVGTNNTGATDTIYVALDASGTGAQTLTYTYPGTSAPTITSISPNNDPVSQGGTVTITGTGLTGTSSITVGGIAATPIIVNSDTKVVTGVPAGASPGPVDVVLTAPGGTVTSTGGFTYLPTPTITSLDVTSGTEAGGTTVVITGTHLQNISSISFNTTQQASFTSDSDTQVTVVTPASSVSGPVDIDVWANGVDAKDVGAFTYVAPPESISDCTITGAKDRYIDFTNHIVYLEVPSGTDLTTLAPSITVSSGDSLSPNNSGVAEDYTGSVQYTVTDGATSQIWTVYVGIQGSPRVIAGTSSIIGGQPFDIYIVGATDSTSVHYTGLSTVTVVSDNPNEGTNGQVYSGAVSFQHGIGKFQITLNQTSAQNLTFTDSDLYLNTTASYTASVASGGSGGSDGTAALFDSLAFSWANAGLATSGTLTGDNTSGFTLTTDGLASSIIGVTFNGSSYINNINSSRYALYLDSADMDPTYLSAVQSYLTSLPKPSWDSSDACVGYWAAEANGSQPFAYVVTQGGSSASVVLMDGLQYYINPTSSPYSMPMGIYGDFPAGQLILKGQMTDSDSTVHDVIFKFNISR